MFTLGDVGYVDADGYVFITDRIADMVVSGGVNLYPAESEQVLSAHPASAEVAVIGVPHPDLGEQLLALVVAKGTPPDPAELEEFARQQLAPYKVPRAYEFRTELDVQRDGQARQEGDARPVLGRPRTSAATRSARRRSPRPRPRRPCATPGPACPRASRPASSG